MPNKLNEKDLAAALNKYREIDSELKKIKASHYDIEKHIKAEESAADEVLKKYEQIHKAYEEKNKAFDRAAMVEKEINEKSTELMKMSLDDKERYAELQEKINLLFKEKTELEKASRVVIKDNTGELEEQLKKHQEIIDTLKVQHETQLRTKKLEEEAAKKRDDSLDKFETSLKVVLAGTLGISDAWKSSAAASYLALVNMGEIEQANKRLIGVFKEAGDNIGPSMFEKIIESSIHPVKGLIMAQDRARASFVASTGAMDDQIMKVIEMQRQYSFAGVSVQSYGQAYTELYNKLSMFSNLSSTQQGKMSANVAMLERLGISAALAADSHANLIVRFGVTIDQSQDMIRSFAALSGAGISAAEAVDGFNKALPTLIKYGQGSVKIYKELIVASKTLKVSTDDLLGAMSQYDTFESAATAAGKLNAVLGGDYINSVELMSATESERIEMLIRAREESGKTWDGMNKFEKQALANAAGISDMNMATGIFTKNLSEYRKEQLKASSAGMSAKELEDRARATQTIAEDFESIRESFAVSFGPAIGYLKQFMEIYAKANNGVLEFFGNTIGLGTLIGGVAGIYSTFSILMKSKFIKAMVEKTTVTAADTAATILQEKAQSAANKSVGTAAKTSKMAAGSMAAMGVAALGIGVGIGAAAYGIAQLAKGLEGLGPQQLKTLTILGGGLIIGIVGGVIALGAAGKAASPGLLIIAGAAIALGGAFALAALGASEFAKSLQGVDPEVFYGIAQIMKDIGFAAPFMAVSSMAMMAVAASIAAFAASMELMDKKALETFSNLMQAITNVTPEVSVRFVAITDGIKDAMQAVSEIGINGSMAVQSITKAVESGSGTSNSGGGKKEIHITLELDKKPLQKVVVDIINDEAKVRKNL